MKKENQQSIPYALQCQWMQGIVSIGVASWINCRNRATFKVFQDGVMVGQVCTTHSLCAASHGWRLCAGGHLVGGEEMIHCEDCKWWGQKPGRQGNPLLRSCGHPAHVMGYRAGASVPANGLLVESDEGWGMETGPRFGCVNGEAKH